MMMTRSFPPKECEIDLIVKSKIDLIEINLIESKIGLIECNCVLIEIEVRKA
jgi:hypothetical protein